MITYTATSKAALLQFIHFKRKIINSFLLLPIILFFCSNYSKTTQPSKINYADTQVRTIETSITAMSKVAISKLIEYKDADFQGFEINAFNICKAYISSMGGFYTLKQADRSLVWTNADAKLTCPISNTALIKNSKIYLKLNYTCADSKNSIYNNSLTPTGGSYNIQLPDGSLVWTNAESKLTYPIFNSALIKNSNTSLRLNYTCAYRGNSIYNINFTPTGGSYNIQLADGSQVWTNADSMLTYPISNTAVIKRENTFLKPNYLFTNNDRLTCTLSITSTFVYSKVQLSGSSKVNINTSSLIKYPFSFSSLQKKNKFSIEV